MQIFLSFVTHYICFFSSDSSPLLWVEFVYALSVFSLHIAAGESKGCVVVETCGTQFKSSVLQVILSLGSASV